jgi:hypothetical protein
VAGHGEDRNKVEKTNLKKLTRRVDNLMTAWQCTLGKPASLKTVRNSFLSFTPSIMPATRSSKRTKKAAPAAEAPEAAQDIEEGPSKLPKAIAHVAEVAVNVTEAAEEFVDKMTGIEENGKATEEGEKETGKAEVTNGSEAARKTTKERRAKMEQLRKKIVSLVNHQFITSSSANWSTDIGSF